MSYLRSAGFGDLFAVPFTIGGTFLVLLASVGVADAIVYPNHFIMHGVANGTPTRAILIVGVMLLFLLVLNAVISAIGAGAWLLMRRVAEREQ